MIRSSCFTAFALANVLCAQAPPASLPTPSKLRPIDLVICLDVSGSMEGLINAARQNLWAVANELATLQPAPQLRVALLTFGCTAYDPETGWVRRETGFTTDLDTVSQKLFALTTNGGEEYVARVMQTALQLDWSSDPQALKLLFVAGNEAATQDPLVDGPAQSRAAIAQGIVVNTIFCGSPVHADAAGWREVGKLAAGQFATIQKDDAVVITTPLDATLTELSAAINTTYLAYGKEGAMWAMNQGAQDDNAAGMNPAAAAQRCQTKATGLYTNPHWDLVDACRDPKFRLEDLKKDELPAALRSLPIEELRKQVAAHQKKRTELQKKIEALGQERDAYVLAERRKLGAAGKAMFDEVVLEAVRQQAEARGFRRAPKPAPAGDCDSPFVPAIKAAVRDYQKFVRVTGEPRVAPTDCRAHVPPPVRLSVAEKVHGGKLYLLYARHAEGLEYVQAGAPAAIGQTLVKEAWCAFDGEPTDWTEASHRYAGHLVVRSGERVHHAGDAAGLFVMHKLDPRTEGTDDGWVYATLDRAGHVTAAGRIASCIRCHAEVPEDRRFGLR